jgi:uncharacterized protein (TIGR00730 family)
MIKSVTVFCASSTRVPQKYIDATKEIGHELTRYGIDIFYGAGAVGLMGTLADTILTNNGKATGIIPHFMKELEWAHSNLSDLIVVDNMPLRKQMLIDSGDAVLALPGGCGTLDELLEVITLKQLGQYKNPIIILNTDGFYNPLITMLNKMVEENFMRETHRKIWTLINHPAELIPALRQAPAWDTDMIKMAQI